MILIFSITALAVFIIGTVYRGRKIARMPVHLRWELAPVPHEKGKAHYGGSYFEEYEWWTKPREKSLVSEMWYMFQEIIFLKGIFENKRSLWYFSFPFHFGGLYLMAAAFGLMILGALFSSPVPLTSLTGAVTGIGYLMAIFGVAGLFYRRLTDPDVAAFTTFAHFFNLGFLMCIYITGLWAMVSMEGYISHMTGFVKAMMTFNFSYALAAPAKAHVFFAGAFLIYLPFTYMMHFVAKYFTYHEIRWNDEPMTAGSPMEKEVGELLGQKITWAAPHIAGGGTKTWVDAATEEVK